MTPFKALFFLFAMIAVALAIEGVREKKQVLIGAPLAEDGSWWPGKYDPVAIPAVYPYAGIPAYRSIIY